jgi:hypothetical protein
MLMKCHGNPWEGAERKNLHSVQTFFTAKPGDRPEVVHDVRTADRLSVGLIVRIH